MHELGITQSVVEAVLEIVDKPRITRLRLEIGKLSGVVPDSVRFCFGLVAEGTALEGACLDIVEPAGSGLCRACGTEFELRDLYEACECGSADVAVMSGQELRIKAVEVG